MTSPDDEASPLEQAVAVHGRELAVVRRLLERACRDAVTLYSKWKRYPKGTAMSAITRDRFLELANDDPDLALSEIEVFAEGEDWVRIWLPKLGWKLPLRTRPKVVRIEDGSGWLGPDLFGDPPLGTPVLFWRWDFPEDRLAFFSLVRVLNTEDRWVMECKGLEEIELTLDLLATPAATSVTPGSSNDDDDLDDVVGRWDSEDPQSEAETTERQYRDNHDDESDSAVGDDSL
jgi:hypothetical protein